MPLGAARQSQWISAQGQNEPCHSLHRHSRSTSVSGPVGLAVGASGSGHERTHALQQISLDRLVGACEHKLSAASKPCPAKDIL